MKLVLQERLELVVQVEQAQEASLQESQRVSSYDEKNLSLFETSINPLASAAHLG